MGLFDNSHIPGRISPGEFSLKSGELGVQYGHLFNQAYQESANRKMKSDMGKPSDLGHGYVPGMAPGNTEGELMFPGRGFGTDEG